MNAFYEHHKDSIEFGYRCFDRLLLNGLIQPFQQPERVVGFFNTYRQQYPVSGMCCARSPASFRTGLSPDRKNGALLFSKRPRTAVTSSWTNTFAGRKRIRSLPS